MRTPVQRDDIEQDPVDQEPQNGPGKAEEVSQASAPKKPHRKRRGARSYKHSGYYSLMRRLKVAGGMDTALDRRTVEARELFGWMTVLCDHLGGKNRLTAPQETLVQRAGVTEVLLRQLETELLKTGAIVMAEDGSVRGHNLLEHYRGLMRAQTDILKTLGLKRQVVQVNPLDVYVKQRYGSKGDTIETASEAPDASA